MVIKLKEKFEKTRHVKNNDKLKKYILRGQRNTRYPESQGIIIIFSSFKYVNSIFISCFIFIRLIINYCILIHPVICNIEILWLVSDDWCWVIDASCVPGVICFFVHY